MPAYVLSEITLRSNYAIAPTIENTMRPAAVLVLENAECMFSELISAGRLKIQYEFITRENINQLIADGGYDNDIDLLVIDIDGNDAHVWQAINVIHPRVVCIEYNATCGPTKP